MEQDPNQRPQEEPRGEIPTPNVPGVPPPPPQQGSSPLRWAIIGVAGCASLGVFLLFGLVGCLALLGGGGEPECQDQPTVAVGEPLALDGAVWTVTDANKVNRLAPDQTELPGNDFIVVDFDFTNREDTLVYLDDDDLMLVANEEDEDAEGVQYEVEGTDDFNEYVPDDREIDEETVEGGVTQQAQAVFMVDDDTSGFQLSVPGSFEPEGSRTEIGCVNLGF